MLGSRGFSSDPLFRTSFFRGAQNVIDSNVARRYARALLALAGTEGSLEKTADQLSMVAASVASGPAAGLLAPGAPRAQQKGIVEALAGKLDKPVADLLRLLVERNRFDGLVQIARAFSQMVDEKLGRVRATVSSAAPLGDSELQKIGAQLERATGKKISLEQKLDASLIGGISADVGGILFDGSVKTQLETLRQQLRAPTA